MLVGFLVLACGPTPPKTPLATAAGPDFARDEQRVLHLLASADGRFARRAGIQSGETELREPAVQAILSEDASAMMEGGRVDLFSFDARARTLDAASTLVAQYNPKDRKNGLEIERLTRLCEEERARLTRERDLPKGAGPLLLGLAATWQSNVSPAEIEQHDARLAKRFDEVTQSLKRLSPEERDELEASLDPIEGKLSVAFSKSQIALVHLRVKLGEVPIDAQPLATTPLADTTTEARLLDLEMRLKTAYASRLSAEGKLPANTPQLDTESCRFSGAEASQVGRIGAPPERQVVCNIVKTLTSVTSANPSSATLAAFHDYVVVAVWAIQISKGKAPHVVISAPRPLVEMTPHLEAQLTRDAALRPAEALGTALAIEWLMAEGVDNLAKRAASWRILGDAPIDLAIHELGR